MLVMITLAGYNEKKYIIEWINFHIKQGASLIYLYVWFKKRNNKMFNSFVDLIKENSLDKYVILKHIKHVPRTYLPTFLKNYGDKHFNDWGAFLDIDEFLYSPHDNKKITDIIKLYEQREISCVAVNWLCFGSNGLKEEQNSVIDVYTKCTRRFHGINNEVKSLFKISALENGIEGHMVNLKEGYERYNVNFKKVSEHNSKNMDKIIKANSGLYDDEKRSKKNLPRFNKMIGRLYPEENPNLIINHYILRSEEEFKLKTINNDTETVARYTMKMFRLRNKFMNEVENKDILTKR